MAMFNEIAKSSSAMEKILKPSLEGAGLRIFPARTQKNDAKHGLRLDKGEPVTGKDNTVSVNLQINSNADRNTLRNLASKDPHRVIARVEVDITQEATKENLWAVRDKLLEEVDDLDL